MTDNSNSIPQLNLFSELMRSNRDISTDTGILEETAPEAKQF